MIVKKCLHCEKPYQPKLKGYLSVICRSCILDCDEAYNKILIHLRREGDTTLEKAFTALGVPAYFVEALLREGRFDEYTGKKKPPACKRCNTKLSAGERDMCERCSKSVMNQVKFVSHHGEGEVKDLDVLVNQPIQKQATKTSREKRFGLGSV